MPGLRLSYWNTRLLRTVFFELQQQQQAGLFCDVTLQGDGEGIHVHSCVIAACSPYLANLLMCPTEISEVSDPKTPISSSRQVLWISGIKSLHLFPLVHYMYTSELEVAPADVSDVLKAAQKLQIQELELLKLEAGRLVRPDPGRRLNRNCLGSKAHTLYANTVKQVKDKNQGILNPFTCIEAKPTRITKNKIVNVTSVMLDHEQNNENVLDIETSSCGTSGNVLDSVFGSGSSLEDLVNRPEYLENVLSNHDLLQHVLSNQSSQQDAPPSHKLKEDIEDSQDLIERTLNSQDFAQDVKSNQNSAIHVARSLDLTECKLKASLDCLTSHPQKSKTVKVYGLLDHVQCSQDLFAHSLPLPQYPAHCQSIGELPEGEPRVRKLPEDGVEVGKLPEDGTGVGKLPEDKLCDDGPGIEELPKDGLCVGELPEDFPVDGEFLEVGQAVGESLEDGQSSSELPGSGQGIGNLPAGVQGSEDLIEENCLRGQDTQEKSLKRCKPTLHKHNSSNPEVTLTQDRKCFVEGQQSRNHPTSSKGLLKRIKVDRKNEDFKLLNLKSSRSSEAYSCSNIDISVSDTLEKHDICHWRNPCLSEHGLDIQQSSHKYVFYKDDSADPLVGDANINHSVPHAILKGIKMPDIDVGVYSPPILLEACVWPDLSSDSDMEIDIVG